VGEGPGRDRFAARAEDLGLAGHVTWTGLVCDPFAEGVYAAADVVCQVSRWQEVFGCTIAEAMALSKPLVATRVGGIPELVRDGITGFLTERGDARAIADKILLLLKDSSLRERMGAAGREAAVDLFDCRKNVNELIRVYGIK
jgi:L-malate glycosyltransferase